MQQERAYLVEQLSRHAWRVIENAQAIGINHKAPWEDALVWQWR